MDETAAEIAGTVTESLPNDLFRVALDNGQTVRAHVSDRLRMSLVRVLPGDRVLVTLSEYDGSRGRITGRCT